MCWSIRVGLNSVHNGFIVFGLVYFQYLMPYDKYKHMWFIFNYTNWNRKYQIRYLKNNYESFISRTWAKIDDEGEHRIVLTRAFPFFILKWNVYDVYVSCDATKEYLRHVMNSIFTRPKLNNPVTQLHIIRYAQHMCFALFNHSYQLNCFLHSIRTELGGTKADLLRTTSERCSHSERHITAIWGPRDSYRSFSVHAKE